MRLCPDAARARSLRASAFNNKGGRRTMTTLGTRFDSLSFPASRIDDIVIVLSFQSASTRVPSHASPVYGYERQ